MAWSMRELILVTFETSSNESSFFSRALRNLSPKSPTLPAEDGNIIGQAECGCHCQEFKGWVTRKQETRNGLDQDPTSRKRSETLRQAQGRLWGTRQGISGFFSQGQGELGFAGDGRVVEGFGGAVAFGGFKVESAFEVIGKSGEAGFAVGVGADFEVKLASVRESVRDVNVYFGRVDGGAGCVCDSEIGRAGAEAAVDDRDRFRIRSGLREGQAGCGEKEESQ